LRGRWVLGVAGTHGKTTTSSLLAWILEDNDLAPGYLIGGVPENFGESARLGDTPFFVIEADEYDTAFCDKRSKFVHYQPRTLILNNLEFDHADIFTDLAAIQTQFNHLLRTVSQNGQIIHNSSSEALNQVLEMGCWSETKSFNGSVDASEADWRVEKIADDASSFRLIHANKSHDINWSLIGDHNMANAVAAIAAAHHVGIPVANSIASLTSFRSVKRRMELIYEDQSLRVYDDFAHHPTAISETLNGLRSRVGKETIIAILEPRSNTMKRGVHKHLLQDALANADQVLIFADTSVQWNIEDLNSENIHTFNSTEKLLFHAIGLVTEHTERSNKRSNVLIMSNGGFENLHQRLIEKVSRCFAL